MDDAVEFDYCANCKLPLPRGREHYRRVCGDTLCLLCYDIRDVISANSFMSRAHDEYEEDKKRLNKLRPGGKYLD